MHKQGALWMQLWPLPAACAAQHHMHRNCQDSKLILVILCLQVMLQTVDCAQLSGEKRHSSQYTPAEC